MTRAPSKPERTTIFSVRHRLPLKLLAVTVFGVLLAEIVIFIPSVANHRKELLQQRIDAAHISALTMQVVPREMLTPERVRDIFSTADIKGVGLFKEGRSQLVLAPDLDPSISSQLVFVNLENPSPVQLVADAMAMMFSRDNPYLLVRGEPTNMDGVMVEMIIQRRPMRLALWRYARSIFWLSLFVSVIAAAILYFALLALFVRPMIKLTQNMQAFQEHPQDATKMMVPTNRRDEIGDAERVLARMQQEVRSSLKQKEKLATLGEGVSKISHDLRNVLASAMLISDRFAASDDPRVQKLAPRLVQALNRAVSLSRAIVDYGKVQDVHKQALHLFDIVEEIDDSLAASLKEEPIIRIHNEVDPDQLVHVDRLQFFRALSNLVRNAADALRGSENPKGIIRIEAMDRNDGVDIRIIDNGPGLPEEARSHLFQPFKGSARLGGSGLGLAIAFESIEAHGGTLALEKTGAQGTVFLIHLPKE